MQGEMEHQLPELQTIQKRHPVDTGIKNAKTEIEEASGGRFRVSDETVEELQKNLRKIYEQKLGDRQIPEEFLPALFELTALGQFHKTKEGLPLWDDVELEKVMGSLWDILRKFIKPSKPDR